MQAIGTLPKLMEMAGNAMNGFSLVQVYTALFSHCDLDAAIAAQDELFEAVIVQIPLALAFKTSIAATNAKSKQRLGAREPEPRQRLMMTSSATFTLVAWASATMARTPKMKRARRRTTTPPTKA